MPPPPADAASASEDQLASAARRFSPAIVAAIFSAVAMRLVVLVHYRTDSDEPQHLHVVWEWSRGLVAYRDFYDNHFPLFHILFAPLMRVAGERPDILTVARVAMLPLAIGTIALTWFIARKLYDSHVAFWAAIAISLFPPAILKGVEFRNDNLWTLLSVATVAIVSLRQSPRWVFGGGVVAGAALASSIKSVSVIAAIGVALLIVERRHLARAARLIGSFGAGVVIIPAAGAVWFASHGALEELVRNAILINGAIPVAGWRRAGGALLLIGAMVLAVRIGGRELPRERAVVALWTVLFPGFVFAVSPLISPRDFLALYPTLAIFMTAAVLRRRRDAGAFIPIVLIGATIVHGHLLRPQNDHWDRVLAEALRLTEEGEPVLDLKGETVFRPRATYLAIEPAARHAMASGAMPETMVRDITAARCHVVAVDSKHFPPTTRRFLNEHFIDAGPLRVAASRVRGGEFVVAVAGPYTVLYTDGRASASRWYERGRHRAPRRAALLVWSRAVERGFRGFTHRDGVPLALHRSEETTADRPTLASRVTAGR